MSMSCLRMRSSSRSSGPSYTVPTATAKGKSLSLLPSGRGEAAGMAGAGAPAGIRTPATALTSSAIPECVPATDRPRLGAAPRTPATCPWPRERLSWWRRPPWRLPRNLPPEYPKPGADSPRIFSPLLHGKQSLHQRVGRPAVAFDAADSGRPASFVDLGHGVFRAEDLVQISHRADIGIPRVVPPHARRVGHHGLQLLPDHGLGIGQQDRVPVRL